MTIILTPCKKKFAKKLQQRRFSGKKAQISKPFRGIRALMKVMQNVIERKNFLAEKVIYCNKGTGSTSKASQNRLENKCFHPSKYKL